MSPLRVAVAVSGEGRSLRNLIELQEKYSYTVCGVISSSSSCKAVDFSRDKHLPLFISDFKLKSEEQRLELWLEEQAVGLIALAGFLKPFPCLKGFKNRMINIHPALLPKFGGKGMYGMHVHRAVHGAKEQMSGATVHFVSESYDEGAIIAQARVLLSAEDSPETIAHRVFDAERRLYPEVLDGLSTGRLPLPNGQVYIVQES